MFVRTTLAGMPMARVLGGIFLVIIDLESITALEPMSAPFKPSLRG